MDGINVTQSLFTSLVSLFVGGAGVAWFNAWQSRKSRISGDEREARRDMVSDRDSLIDRLMQRVDALEAQRDEDEENKRALRADLAAYGDHIDILEAHIWGGKPPPPPARPVLL